MNYLHLAFGTVSFIMSPTQIIKYVDVIVVVCSLAVVLSSLACLTLLQVVVEVVLTRHDHSSYYSECWVNYFSKVTILIFVTFITLHQLPSVIQIYDTTNDMN